MRNEFCWPASRRRCAPMTWFLRFRAAAAAQPCRALPITKASDRLQVHVTSVARTIRRRGLMRRVPHPTIGDHTVNRELGRSTVETPPSPSTSRVFANVGMGAEESQALVSAVERLRRNAGDEAGRRRAQCRAEMSAYALLAPNGAQPAAFRGQLCGGLDAGAGLVCRPPEPAGLLPMAAKTRRYRRRAANRTAPGNPLRGVSGQAVSRTCRAAIQASWAHDGEMRRTQFNRRQDSGPLMAHQRAQDAFAALLAASLTSSAASTPCSEWTINDLIEHVVGGNEAGRAMGGPIEPPARPDGLVAAAKPRPRSPQIFAAPGGMSADSSCRWARPGGVFIGLRTTGIADPRVGSCATGQSTDLDPEVGRRQPRVPWWGRSSAGRKAASRTALPAWRPPPISWRHFWATVQ